MVIYLVDQALRQRLVIGEPCQQCHPVMKFGGPVNRPHPFVIIRNDLNERSHDMRKEDDTDHHHSDSKYHFNGRNRIQVTIAYSRKRGECKIARDDHLGISVLNLINLKILQESISFVNIFL